MHTHTHTHTHALALDRALEIPWGQMSASSCGCTNSSYRKADTPPPLTALRGAEAWTWLPHSAGGGAPAGGEKHHPGGPAAPAVSCPLGFLSLQAAPRLGKGSGWESPPMLGRPGFLSSAGSPGPKHSQHPPARGCGPWSEGHSPASAEGCAAPLPCSSGLPPAPGL